MIGEIEEIEAVGENHVVQVKSVVVVQIPKITTIAMVKMVVLMIHGVAQEVWIVDLHIHIINTIIIITLLI